MSKPDLTADRLRELLSYYPETGVFRWKDDRGARAKKGDIAGGIHKARGYWRIRVDDILCYAHQLAWLYVHGTWPKDAIDHIDGDRINNRISNLREASASINSQNRRYGTGRGGLLGITANGSGWMALIGHAGKKHYLGTFRTPEQAHAAYLDGKRRLHEGNTL